MGVRTDEPRNKLYIWEVVLAILLIILLWKTFICRDFIVFEIYEVVLPYFSSKESPPPRSTLKLDENPKRAVIVMPSGGLGSQLFMYAAAYAFARQTGLPLFVSPASEGHLDFGYYPEPHPNTMVREFLLHNFNLPAHQLVKYKQLQDYISSAQIIPVTQLKYETLKIETSRLPQADESWQNQAYVFQGMLQFQSHVFFQEYRPELKEILSLESYIESRWEISNVIFKELQEQLLQGCSVAVHVRRGDFLDPGVPQKALPISYYSKCLQRMTKQCQVKPSIFLFSDNISEVEKEFSSFGSAYSITSVSGKEGITLLKEFQLMIDAKEIIIANSGFSWWAAYLNSNMQKVVLAPFPKFPVSGSAEEPQDIDIFPPYPPEWTRVNPWKNVTS